MFSSFCFVGVSAYSTVLIVHCSLTNHLRLHDLKLVVGGGIGMGNTCISMADSCQCMTKTTTIL